MNLTTWIPIDRNYLLPFKPDFSSYYEPSSLLRQVTHRYSILRRSPRDPILHPYYIEYGFNCIELYERLKSNGHPPSLASSIDYHFYTMTMDFGIDIPHRR